MIRKTILISVVALLMTGCVSMKKYRETQSELLSLKYGDSGYQSELAELQREYTSLEEDYEYLREEYNRLRNDGRVAELEAMLAERDEILNQLRSELQDAVGDLQGRGLSLDTKNGKIYVLMDDKLLFESGKYDLTKEGERAVKDIGGVLAKMTKVEIIVEGHTDSRGLLTREGAQIVDNWDLSCKRATEVVRLLNKTKGLKSNRITAAGRGQYMPVADNNTESGRAQNRRTEIILTPKLEGLAMLLEM